MQQFKNLKIGILGLGLIGGSLYKNLLQNGGAELFACTGNDSTLKKIISDGCVADKNADILKECEIVFVCSPISETVNSVKKVFAVNQNAIIVDVASLKQDILNDIESLKGCRFIGSHPMAGTENHGFEASFSSLFEEAVWVITPSKNVTAYDIELLKSIIMMCGAKPLMMNAAEHDKAVAMISHLPMLLAQSLMLTALENDNNLLLAASGFRDTTRLAMTNKTLAKDMLMLNKNNIKNALRKVIGNAESLLESDFFDNNSDFVINKRKLLYNSSGKNNFIK